MYQIKKGLDLPISGAALGDVQSVLAKSVGVLGQEFNGMKPTMLVETGDVVLKGQKLFEDKKNPGVFYTAPIAGKITAVYRGDKRVLQSVVIERQGDEEISFKKYSNEEISNLNIDNITNQLLESGLWTSFRTRPFSKVPTPNTKPSAIFVTAMDTNPLAINPEDVIAKENDAFIAGLNIVSKLTDGKTYVCKKAGSSIDCGSAKVETPEFSGPHPSGLVGTHIHMLEPVSLKKTVWHLNYQDVIIIGRLFLTGSLDTTKTIGIVGPEAKSPRLIKTETGACLFDLLEDQEISDDIRIVNGSVLSGLSVIKETAYLAKYALQIFLLKEGDDKEFMGWLRPGSDKFTATKVYLGGFVKGMKKLFPMTTSSGGSARAIIPIDVYEKVMPLNILPVPLLRTIIVKDTDEAQRLGILELDEEDIALCTFVCPSKYEYGAILRENLEQIEKDG